MEVYVRDEELESKNRSYKFVGNDKIKFSTNNMGIIQIEEYFAQIKSLEQHDAELKAKWCDLIITILDYEIIPLGDSKEDWYVKSKFIYLQEKLEQMKGEK